MKQPVQKRTLKTRARLTEAAQTLVAQGGYEALRVEEVVKLAGVAKGTFFAHFPDKDALMTLLIGAEIDAHLDKIADLPALADVAALVSALDPLMRFMSCERYVFDVILRHSGVAMSDQIGPIAQTFERHLNVVADWLRDGPFRRDITPELMAEGVQAFMIQVLALHFCVLHADCPMQARMRGYLEAWLLPRS